MNPTGPLASWWGRACGEQLASPLGLARPLPWGRRPLCTRSGHRLVLQAPASEAVTPVHPQVLIDWINDVLVEERIIVKQLEEDLYDGQVLQKLLGESPGGAARNLDHAMLYVATSVNCP